MWGTRRGRHRATPAPPAPRCKAPRRCRLERNSTIRATLRRQIATHLARSLPRCPCCLRSFLRSPRIAHRVQLHLAYSNQIAEGGGVITGGLDNVAVCSPDPVTGITP